MIINEDEEQKCPLLFSAKVARLFDHVIEVDTEKKIYLQAALPHKINNEYFEYDQLACLKTGLTDEWYDYSISLIDDLRPFRNVVADPNHKWIFGIKNEKLYLAKKNDLNIEEARTHFLASENLGNVLKTTGMHFEMNELVIKVYFNYMNEIDFFITSQICFFNAFKSI